MLRGVLEGTIASGIPEGFTLLTGASEIQITSMKAGSVADQSGNFSMFGAARLRAIAIREADIKTMISALSVKEYEGTEFRDLALTYENIKPKFDVGEIAFAVVAKGTLQTSFNVENFRVQIAKKKIGEVRELVARLPGLNNVTISLWPRWIGRVPARESRITINVQ